jgi:hypothetical protein
VVTFRIPKDMPLAEQRVLFDKAAEAYAAKLRGEHIFTDTTPRARQRMITLESLDLVRAHRPDFHLFNSLLVQYRKSGGGIGQVVPDNMVVLYRGELKNLSCFDLPLQPVGPFVVMEYVSEMLESGRIDDPDSFRKYERDLKVPYLLQTFPDVGKLTLYRHNRRKYVTVKPDARERYVIPELELELGLVEGWIRYWYQGELLALPPELQKELDEVRAQNARLQQQLTRQAEQIAALQAELERLRKDRPAS